MVIISSRLHVFYSRFNKYRIFNREAILFSENRRSVRVPASMPPKPNRDKEQNKKYNIRVEHN